MNITFNCQCGQNLVVHSRHLYTHQIFCPECGTLLNRKYIEKKIEPQPEPKPQAEEVSKTRVASSIIPVKLCYMIATGIFVGIILNISLGSMFYNFEGILGGIVTGLIMYISA
jgi:hypothetical protein